jgi:hypothetical protein
MITFRNQRLPYSQLLQIEAGVLASKAAEEDPAAGLADEVAWDGSIFYHDDQFGVRTGQLDVYAGRDGICASLRDGRMQSGDTVSRLQLSGRLWPFYREGFYRGDSFVPTGQYEGNDYEGYLGFGRLAGEDLFIEFGPFYHMYEFDRNEATAANYVIPEDYDAYGIRMHLEQNNVQLDRRSGLPREGFLATAVVEREWNDSDTTFGVVSGFQTRLPSAVWRLRGRMEWYLPQASDGAWEIFASGQFVDEKDRVVQYDAQHPQGNLWVDAQLRLRLPVAESFTLTPFVHGQFTRILDETGSSSDQEFFFGGGVETWLHFSDAVSFNAWYSYLDNESRPPVSIDEDLHGQHMGFAGLVLRFGASRN